MHTPSWLSGQSLTESINREPWRWDFAQMTRLLEVFGETFQVDSDPACQYACAELTSAHKTQKGWQFTTTIPALEGYHGVLPYAYQDVERKGRLSSETADIRMFFSMFNHRIYALTAKVATRSDLGIHYERAHREGAKLSNALLGLVGLSIPTQHIPRDNLVRYIVVLTRWTTNLEILSKMLCDYFSLDIELSPPPVVRKVMSEDSLTRLRTRVKHDTECVGYLGRNTVCGRSCYLLHSQVNIILRVKNRQAYHDIIHDFALRPAIVEMCTLYFSGSARFRVQIKCPRHCLSPPRLSAKPQENSARLGLLSCLAPQLRPEEMIVVDFPEFSRQESQ